MSNAAQTTVTIKKGQFFGKQIEGTFPLINMIFNKKVRPHNAHRGDGKIVILDGAEEKAVWVFHGDYVVNGEFKSPFNVDMPETVVTPFVPETIEEMKARINKRFNVMSLMTKGLINGSIRSLIISGAAGIGKTFTLDRDLNEAAENGEIEYVSANGKLSGIGLYERLWETKEKGSVLLLDDIDIFSNEDVLNLLKAALDSGEKRKVCWGTATDYLEKQGIEKEFEYEGTVVFITNTDIDAEIQRATKIAPHLMALVSRSVYLDLGVHSNEEIMIRVEDVILSTTMLQNVGISDAQAFEVLEWMKKNVKRLRNVSLRTASYLAQFILTDETNWMEIAEVTQLR